MEDIMPKPLRVIKNQSNPKHEICTVSCPSCPPIPCRKSSLRVDQRQYSTDPTNSAPEPILSNNPRQIKIRKRNRAYTQPPSQGREGQKSVSYSAGFDELSTFPGTNWQDSSKPGNRVVPRFFSGWSFKPRGSTMGRLTSDQTNYQIDAYPASASNTYNANGIVEKKPGPIAFPSQEPPSRENSDFPTPRAIPITGISMKHTSANPPTIGTGPDSIWTTVGISAEVNPNEPCNLGWPVPLNIVLILDNVPHTHTGMLRQTVLSSLAVVSALTDIDDRFAIAYIDKDLTGGFGLLLPLGTHSFDCARVAMDTFSLRQLTSQRAGNTELQGVIQQISKLFYLSERPAFCHVFFVTASPSVQLSTPAIDKRISLHTISPHFRFPFNGLDVPSGWHIFYDTNIDSKEFTLKDKVSTVIQHIRTGVEPGVVTDLKLSLIASDRCQVQADLEESHLDSLRLGERWVIPVQISVPATSIKQPLRVIDGDSWNNSHPTLDKAMVQLQELLADISCKGITQHIMSAQLEYKHSLLPADNIIHLGSSFTVVRDAHEF